MACALTSRSAYATDIWRPSSAAPIHWQLQLGSQFNVATDIVPGVTVYDIDAFDTPASVVAELHRRGCFVIGYFSFGSYEDWRPDAASFPASVKGSGNGWAGERWLDIRNLAVLGPILTARLNTAKAKGFDAIDPDNVDGYTNSTGFPLTAQDQLAFNRWIADQCHQRGFSVGLKNDVNQLTDLQPWFDWALNEQSYYYSEYSGYSVFTDNNKAVFEVEYRANTAQATVMNSRRINSTSRDANLMGPTSSAYRRLPCIPDTQNTWTGSPSPTPTPTPTPVPTPTPTPNVPPLSGWYCWNDAKDCYLSFSFGATAWDYLRAFIDADVDASTGFAVGGIGAEYKIENGNLFRWTGAWTYVKAVPQTLGATSRRWTVARADIGKTAFPATTNVVFQVAMAYGPALNSLKYTHVFSASTGTILAYHARNDASNVYYTATFTRSWTWCRVFIDTDNDANTGYAMGAIGADYLVEDGSLYRSGGRRWSWRQIGAVPKTTSGQVFTWTVARSLIGQTSTPPLSNKIVFNGSTNSSQATSPVGLHSYSY
jgi:hypothetical protein